MRGPKVVVIGAGSFFFGRPVIWNMAHSPVLRKGTLAFVDTKPDVLKTMMTLAKETFKATEAPVKLEGSTDRREVLKGADFVVFTFSDRNAHFRGMDVEIAAKYGVKMCSGDTIGPGGIFRALREIPKALAMAKDVEELAPNAWIINFVNPTTVLGMALMRYAKPRSFAICDGLHEPYNRLNTLKAVGILDQDAKAVPSEVETRMDLRIGGVNHFTWMTKFAYDGQDYLPRWREHIAQQAQKEREVANRESDTSVHNNAHSKARYNACYRLQLMNIFGVSPECIGHTKEYVPYYQGLGASPVDPEPIRLFDAEERAKAMAARWKETEDYAHGRKPLDEFIKSGRGDHATDIIESMWGGRGKSFYINSANRGAVTNMAPDAFLELRCHLDMHGPIPQPFGEMPRGILGLQQQVLDTHELTAKAAATCDRETLLQAMLVDPIVNNVTDAKAIIAETLERQRDALPDGWYR
jgi:alpha-galactosidase